MSSDTLIKYEFGIVVLMMTGVIILVLAGFGENSIVSQLIAMLSLLVAAIIGFAHAAGTTNAASQEAVMKTTQNIQRNIEEITGPLRPLTRAQETNRLDTVSTASQSTPTASVAQSTTPSDFMPSAKPEDTKTEELR